jgi:hypothetical protein
VGLLTGQCLPVSLSPAIYKVQLVTAVHSVVNIDTETLDLLILIIRIESIVTDYLIDSLLELNVSVTCSNQVKRVEVDIRCIVRKFEV